MIRVGSPLSWAAAQHAAAPVVSVAMVAALAAPPPLAPVTPAVVDVARQVEVAAIDLAHELRAVPADHTDRLCDRGDLAVSWEEPVDHSHGAHLSPVGPRPTIVTTAVNGVVVCGDSTWAYMGFEARRTAAGWDVVGVPYIEEEHGDVAGLNLDAGPVGPHEGPADHGSEGQAPGTGHAHDAPDAEGDPAGAHATAPSTPPAPVLPSPSAPTASVPGERWLAGLGPIEPYAAYDPQTSCSPTARPGTVVVRDALLGAHPVTRNLGISRACHIGGRSEHKEGRAFDWGAYVSRPVEREAVERFVQQLFATDADGNTHALARRMGVMYLVWNGRIWSSYRAAEGWRPYSGPSPHTDHIHISFSRAGGDGRTSFFSLGLAEQGVLGLVPTGDGRATPVAAPVAAPVPVTPPGPAPARSGPSDADGDSPRTHAPVPAPATSQPPPDGTDDAARREEERLEAERRAAERLERREQEQREAERRRAEELRREEERRREAAEREAEKAVRDAERREREGTQDDAGPSASRGDGPPPHAGSGRGRGRDRG